MNLKILRVMARLTQAEAAEKVEVNQATISDWERGNYKPGAASISKLAVAYNVNVSDILEAVEATNEARGRRV